MVLRSRNALEMLCLLAAFAIMFQESLSRELLLSQIIWREGVRGPLNSSVLPYIPWNYTGPAVLTEKGKKQHEQLAEYLRCRYDTILLNKTIESIKVYSVKDNCSVSSIKANLASLFPNTTESLLTENVSWTLESLNAADIADEPIFKSTKCKEFEDTEKENDTVKSFLESNSVLQTFQDESGANLSNFYDVFMILDSMSSAHAQGILPRNLETTYDLISMYFGRFTTDYFSKLNISREYAGSLLLDMLRNMELKVSNDSDSNPKLIIYSMDQLLMISLLSLLSNYQEYFVPQFSSCFMLELYNVSGDYLVELWYKQSTQQRPVQLKVPGCYPKCQLAELIRIVRTIATTPWEPKCKKQKEDEPKAEGGFTGKFTIVLFSAITAGVIASIVTYYCARDVFKCMIQKPTDD